MIVPVLAGMLVLSGPVAEAVGDAIGLGGAFLTVWNIAKWPVMLVLVIVHHRRALLRHPQRQAAEVPLDEPRASGHRPGDLLLASLGFAFYVANFSNYNKTYGALGGVIVMLLWLWILNMSLLFGAEFDAENGARPPAPGRHRGRGDHPAAAPGHQKEREAARPGRGGHPHGRELRERHRNQHEPAGGQRRPWRAQIGAGRP